MKATTLAILCLVLVGQLNAEKVWVGKKYKLDRTENFEAVLEAFGMGFFTRKLVLALSPTVELVEKPDGWYELVQETAVKNNNINFKPGVEFIEERPDGDVKGIIVFDGDNKLIQTQPDDPTVKITREFTNDEIIATSQVGGVTGKRWYKLVNSK